MRGIKKTKGGKHKKASFFYLIPAHPHVRYYAGSPVSFSSSTRFPPIGQLMAVCPTAEGNSMPFQHAEKQQYSCSIVPSSSLQAASKEQEQEEEEAGVERAREFVRWILYFYFYFIPLPLPRVFDPLLEKAYSSSPPSPPAA